MCGLRWLNLLDHPVCDNKPHWMVARKIRWRRCRTSSHISDSFHDLLAMVFSSFAHYRMDVFIAAVGLSCSDPDSLCIFSVLSLAMLATCHTMFALMNPLALKKRENTPQNCVLPTPSGCLLEPHGVWQTASSLSCKTQVFPPFFPRSFHCEWIDCDIPDGACRRSV